MTSLYNAEVLHVHNELAFALTVLILRRLPVRVRVECCEK